MIAKLLKHVPLGGYPYCEPYMGAASLFFARPPAPVEVLNDLDGALVNLFRCLQDKEKFEELRHRILYTPYAKSEYVRALRTLANPDEYDDIQRAWAFYVKHNLGIAEGNTPGRWSRAFVSTGGIADTVNKWIMRMTMLEDWHKRLLMAQIDQRDAIEVIQYWDNSKAVFYVDPPYHPATRKSKKVYAQEPDHEHFVKLVDTLLECKGAVVLSGYEHEVFKPLVKSGWQVTRYKTSCHGAVKHRKSGLQGRGAATKKVPRVEVIWTNKRALEMLR